MAVRLRPTFCLSAILLVAITACQSIGVGPAARVAPIPTVASGAVTNANAASSVNGQAIQAAAEAAGRAIVWGAVTNCTCHDYVGTGGVSNAVDKAKIGATVQDALETANSVYFFVTYDPRITSRDRVVAAIIAGGGRIKPGPPTSADD